MQQYQLDSAKTVLKQAQNHLEENLGKDHPELGYVYHHLGRVAFNQGNYEESKVFLEKAITIRQRKLGEHHPEIGRTLFNIAKLSIQEGDFGKADSIYQTILPIYKWAFGKGIRYALVLEQLSVVETALNNNLSLIHI